MKINICALDPEGKINKQNWSLIKSTIKKHARIACETLSLNAINITIYPNKDWCINQTGDGGHTASSDWIQLFIDPTKPLLIPRIVNQSLPATLYHEMNHARRMIKVGFGKNLLETAVSEGLAIVFAEEMFKKFEAPWGKYTKKEIGQLLKIFDKHKHDDKFSYEEWFLGFGKPHWLGYKVGTYITRELRRKSTEFNSINMVDTPAARIYKDWYNSKEIVISI